MYILRLQSLAHIPGMADFGGNLLTSTTPISLRRPDFGNTNIPITLAVDNIGQEDTEVGILRMRIAEDSDPPPNAFFRRDLRVTINDTTGEHLPIISPRYCPAADYYLVQVLSLYYHARCG